MLQLERFHPIAIILWLYFMVQACNLATIVPSPSAQEYQCTYKAIIRTQHKNMMKCASNTVCIPPFLICDGKEDCDDGSDEMNCDGDPEDREMQSNRILCKRNEFRCPDDNGTCILLDQLCDGIVHCPGGYDEGRGKCRDCLRRNCGYKCRITDTEGQCYCPDGSALNEDGRTCSPVDFCQTDNAHRCQQYCKSTTDGYECYCAKNYYLDEDGHTCHVEGNEDVQFIITIAEDQIATVSLSNRTKDVYMQHQLLREDDNYPNNTGYRRVVDYDNHNDIAYITAYLDQQHNDLIAIVNNTEKTLRRDLIGPVLTAVDYVGGNLYYAQTYHSEPGIYVCAADVLFCKRIIAGKKMTPWRNYQHFHDTVMKNRKITLSPQSVIVLHATGEKRQYYLGLAVNPFRGKMVWIDAYGDMSKLMMADMDGNNVEELCHEDNNMGRFYGLGMDLIKDEVYFWSYYTYSIYRMNLITKKLHAVVSSGVYMAHALRYFDGYLYWVEWHKQSLRRAQIRNESCTGEAIRYFNDIPWGLAIKHPHYQPMPMVNPCEKVAKSCPWICLIVPGAEPNTIQGKCLCPDNYIEEEGTCIPGKNITKKKHVHLLEAHSYIDVDYWKELCSKGTACFNGGQCVPIIGNDTFGMTFCSCPAPFIGERCELEDPYAKSYGWILWMLLFFVTVAIGFFLYHKDERCKKLGNTMLHRLTRRNDVSGVRFISDQEHSGAENVPSVSFSTPLFAS